jgi:hypothetical protein
MKYICYLVLLFILVSCNNGQKPPITNPAVTKATSPQPNDMTEEKNIHYTDQQIETFLDSIGRLPTQPMADKTAFYADSIFKHQLQIDRVIAPAAFEKLKHAARLGWITIKTAKSIFGDLVTDSTCNKKGRVMLTYYPFDKNQNEFNEYAICIGDSRHCYDARLYFFKNNRIIANHPGYSHYGADLNHYKDIDGKTVVYYRYEFTDGSGEWWNNFYFYKYDGNNLTPVLNELQNGNVQGTLGPRFKWLESFVQKTRPLTIKMVYYVGFSDTSNADNAPRVIDDSTMVQYTWSERSKTIEGQYSKSGISKPQILSYYLSNNELLFINAYYKQLKSLLHNKVTRKSTLDYLNKIKNDQAM